MVQTKTKNKTIAVLGYGSQGRAIALNLRDSGYEVCIGLASKSRSRKKAKVDKFKTISTISKIVRLSDVIIMALPDHRQGQIFKNEIEKYLKTGSTLLFLHGFSIHFGFIKPPENCNIFLLAPHAPGPAVREKYLGDKSLSAFYAIYGDDNNKTALNLLIQLAEAIGFSKNRLVKNSFADETVGDLFGEQAVLCGGLGQLVMNGYNTLVEKGLPAENAYLEVVYQLDLIVDLIKKFGLEGMYDRISVAARVGSVESGPKIIDSGVKKRMEKLYDSIASGKFANKLVNMTNNDLDQLNSSLKEGRNRDFERIAKKFNKSK